MKFAVSLLLLAVSLVLAGCNTLANRRDLYSPSRGDGYWTKRYEAYERGETVSGEPLPRKKPAADEGIFGISRPQDDIDSNSGPAADEGIFGVSKPSDSY